MDCRSNTKTNKPMIGWVLKIAKNTYGKGILLATKMIMQCKERSYRIHFHSYTQMYFSCRLLQDSCMNCKSFRSVAERVMERERIFGDYLHSCIVCSVRWLTQALYRVTFWVSVEHYVQIVNML